MKRVIPAVVIVTFVAILNLGSVTAYGQGAVVRKPAQEIIEAFGRYFSRTGGKELTKELAELGGEAAVRRVAERALIEGGEDTLNVLVRTARVYGPDALRAADNAVNIPRLLRAIDDLPEEMASQAIRRLAAGTEGRLLAETVERYGAQALRAEVLHPGIGGSLVRHFGEEGAEWASRASRQQAITIARHADDIARLPDSQRSGVLRMLKENFDQTVGFMGKFVEDNPGKVLFTIAGTTVVLTHSDKILGGKGEVVIGADGEPVYVPAPGLIDRIVGNSIQQIFIVVLPILAIACAIWLGTKLWFHYRVTKLKYQVDAIGLSSKLAEEKSSENPTEKQPPA